MIDAKYFSIIRAANDRVMSGANDFTWYCSQDRQNFRTVRILLPFMSWFDIITARITHTIRQVLPVTSRKHFVIEPFALYDERSFNSMPFYASFRRTNGIIDLPFISRAGYRLRLAFERMLV